MEFTLFLLFSVWIFTALRNRSRMKELREDVNRQRQRIDELAQASAQQQFAARATDQRIAELEGKLLQATLTAPEPAQLVASSPARDLQAVLTVPETAVASPPIADPASEAAPGETPATTASIGADTTATDAPVADATATDTPVLQPTATDTTAIEPTAADTPAVDPATGADDSGEAPSVAATSSGDTLPAATAWPPGAASAPVAEAASPPLKPAFDWEGLVGVRLFSWIAGIALVLAAVFFLRYSVDQGWLGPPVRMAIGLLFGTALLVGSEWKGKTVRVTANALLAAGIAILFATVFASNALWHLVGQVPTFGLMVLITAVAVTLSIRHDSIYVALLGLVGGFATPILLSTGDDRPVALFAYLLLLNAGLTWVAHRRRWPLLIAASVGFTALYQWGWIVKFVVDNPAELPLAAGIFLVFPALIAIAQLLARPRTDEAPALPLFQQTATVSAVLPLLFALCLAWVPAFGARFELMFGYLLLLDLGLIALAATIGPGALFVGAGLTTLLVFVGWLPSSYTPAAWPSLLAFVSLFVALFLSAPIVLRRFGRPLDATSARGDLCAPLLLFVFPTLVWLEPHTASPALLFTTLFVLMAGIGVVAVKRERGSLHFIASFFALAAEAAWSAKHLTQDHLHAGLALYAAFGLFYLGVPVIARRLQKRLQPEGSGLVLLLCSLGLLFFLAAGPLAAAALWGMALLLAVLNLGLFFEARTGRLSWLSLGGMLLSWIVIAVWWASAMVTALLVPALAIVAGFAMLIVGGNLWADRRLSTTDAKSPFHEGVYLGLIGHLFLLYVATQAPLAVPPWPLFGVLGVLDLAILAAALYARRAELHVAAIGGSQLILIVWTLSAREHATTGLSWTIVGLVAALLQAGMGVAAMLLAERRGAHDRLFTVGAGAGLFGAAILAAITAAIPEAPPVFWLVLASALPIVGLAWLARRTERHELMLGALLPVSFAGLLWSETNFHAGAELRELALAFTPYLLFTAYPLWLHRRGEKARLPALVAVLAAVPFFMLTRHTMIAAGLIHMIGALPLAQALVLAGLLLHLLRLQPSGERDRGRIVLVAGAALAFVTAAIPLQLENEWVTIGWALEAAALAWLHTRLPHRGLLVGSLGLGAAVAVRLSLNPAIFEYHPRGGAPILNWYLYTYLVSALALLGASWLLARSEDDRLLPTLPTGRSLQASGGTLLLFLVLNIEIADYYSIGRELTFNFSSTLAQDLTYTIGWALFAVALLATGIWLRSRAGRIAALVLLIITVAKCFLHDLWRLGGLYRVGSFIGLALCLALVAIVLQKFVLTPEEEKKRS